MTEMRILTVRQPWAYAIMYGGKHVENRVRNLAGDYRGAVAIHAGAVYDKTADDHPEIRELARRCGVESMSDYLISYGHDAYRHIIGVVNLWAVHQHDGTQDFRCCPNAPDKHQRWAQPDVWHLCFASPRALAQPIPYRGALGLRRLDEETIALITAQLEVSK